MYKQLKQATRADTETMEEQSMVAQNTPHAKVHE